MDLALFGAAAGVSMSRLLCEFRRAAWWRHVEVGLRAILIPPARLRHTYPAATRRGGLVGGYAARAADLARRRLRNAFPAGACRQRVDRSANDMASRVRLESWFKAQER